MDNEQGCSGVEVEEEVKFDMIVRVDECVSDAENKYDFSIDVSVVFDLGGLGVLFSDYNLRRFHSLKTSGFYLLRNRISRIITSKTPSFS